MRSVADQATGRDKFVSIVDRGNVISRQNHDLMKPAGEERIGAHDERVGWFWASGATDVSTKGSGQASFGRRNA
jgi:hypothetical protein